MLAIPNKKGFKMKISKNYGLRLATAGYDNTAGSITTATTKELRKAIRIVLKSKFTKDLKARGIMK
jgi:hypothetical protein